MTSSVSYSLYFSIPELLQFSLSIYFYHTKIKKQNKTANWPRNQNIIYIYKKENNCKQHFIWEIKCFSFLEILRRIEIVLKIFSEQELWIVITIRFTLKSRLPSMEFVVIHFMLFIVNLTNHHIVLNLSALECVVCNSMNFTKRPVNWMEKTWMLFTIDLWSNGDEIIKRMKVKLIF